MGPRHAAVVGAAPEVEDGTEDRGDSVARTVSGGAVEGGEVRRGRGAEVGGVAVPEDLTVAEEG